MFDRFRRGLGLALAVCCLVAGFSLPSAAVAQDACTRVNRALLIGVDDFISRPSTYPASTNNVFAVQEVLQASNIPFASIMIPDAPVASVQALTALIQDTFAEADSDDVSYLYISTHGVLDPQNSEGAALLLSDGQTESRLSPEALQAAFDGIAGVKVLLLDACYSGAFIGKGMRYQPSALCFLGDQYKVLTSSGAMEESWYWNTAESTEATAAQGFQQGAYYFTQALCQCLSPRYGFPADANRDGNVTLHELYSQLMENHAASTPQVYPQTDSFVVFSYDLATAAVDAPQRAPIGDVVFSEAVSGGAEQRLTLEFIVRRPVRVAYQVVNQRDGKWRFDEAQLMYDEVEQYTAYGDEQGAVSPGRKVRSLSLALADGEKSGYMLVQLVSIENGKLTVHAGRVIAIPPAQGELALAVETSDRYAVGNPRELAIFVRHAYPCSLSVSIVDSQGKIVYRLSHRQSTRPLRIDPEGSTFYWDGRDKAGKPVAADTYRVRVTAYLEDQNTTVESAPIQIAPSEG